MLSTIEITKLKCLVAANLENNFEVWKIFAETADRKLFAKDFNNSFNLYKKLSQMDNMSIPQKYNELYKIVNS